MKVAAPGFNPDSNTTCGDCAALLADLDLAERRAALLAWLLHAYLADDGERGRSIRRALAASATFRGARVAGGAS